MKRLLPASVVLLCIVLVVAFFISHGGAGDDLFNLVPLAAAAFLMYSAACAHKPFGLALAFSARWMGSPLFRSAMLTVLLLFLVEFALRCGGYHRTVMYERQRDLLFTPVPNQDCMEKISLTRTHINNYGLRGIDLKPEDLRKRIVLCLGDSITHGYGVSDSETYPARLQEQLDPGRGSCVVLNGGVNAYPIAFMREKYLYLLGQGIRPSVVVVGYSMNEGLLDRYVKADDATKNEFSRRVQWKNFLRSKALYNVVVENWARAYYDKMKGRFAPGLHGAAGEAADPAAVYRGHLEDLTRDARANDAAVIFVAFASFDAQSGKYDTGGALQQAMIRFAQEKGIPCVKTDELLSSALKPGETMDVFYQDMCHLNGRGCDIVAEGVSRVIRERNATEK
jgi:lysophospholipase L1-like esterase